MDMTPETRLKAYKGLLIQWNKKINLVAPGTLAALEERHIADSAQLAAYLPEKPARILDVGSGAGLPGLILAIVAPHHTYMLAERDQRKAAFLRTAVFELGLTHVSVFAGDVNILAQEQPGSFDVVTCRAWADVAAILRQTSPLLASGGVWLLLKGQAVDAELTACGTLFHFTTERWPSKVGANEDERGWVVRLTPSFPPLR